MPSEEGRTALILFSLKQKTTSGICAFSYQPTNQPINQSTHPRQGTVIQEMSWVLEAMVSLAAADASLRRNFALPQAQTLGVKDYEKNGL